MGEKTEAQSLVSVVMPVYNGEKFLHECMDGLLAQTYDALELICVDDGSTDASLAILNSYAEADARVKVISQENAGPGRARNVGINAAEGEYLYFFDCDDWCEPQLLESAVARIEQTGADVVVLPFYTYDVRVGTPLIADWALLRDKFPRELNTWHDNPEWLFRAFSNLPWVKLMRMSFVRENNLRYEEDVRFTEDLMFSAPALVRAKGITYTDEYYIYHRTGTFENTMTFKDRRPLDFLTAFRTLKTWLEDEGVYDELRVAYANWAMESCRYNLTDLNTLESYLTVARELGQNGGLESLGLADFPAEAWQEPCFESLREGLQGDPYELLHKLYVQEREEHAVNRDCREVERLQKAEQMGMVDGLRVELSETKDDLQRRRKWLDETTAYLHQTIDELNVTEYKLEETDSKLTQASQELEFTRAELTAQANSAEQKIGSAVCYVPRKIQEKLIAADKIKAKS